MAQSSDVQVSGTLSEGNWRAILEILCVACQLKGSDWSEWQRSISQTVQSAIQKARSSSQQAATPSKHGYRPACDDYYLEMRELDELGSLLLAIEENEYFYDEEGNAYPATDFW